MTLPPAPRNKNNLPLYTFILAGLMLIAAVLAIVFAPNANDAHSLVEFVILSFPGFVAAGFGERNHRDIRNGVVQEKVKQGALDAFKESGVQATVDAAGRGEATNLAMQALAELLKANTSIHLTHEVPEAKP